jgi:hypothetical protein
MENMQAFHGTLTLAITRPFTDIGERREEQNVNSFGRPVYVDAQAGGTRREANDLQNIYATH